MTDNVSIFSIHVLHEGKVKQRSAIVTVEEIPTTWDMMIEKLMKNLELPIELKLFDLSLLTYVDKETVLAEVKDDLPF